MSINHIIGQGSHSISRIGQSSQKAQKPTTDETSFMDVLRDKFAEVTSQMKGIPGMPGIYSFNIDSMVSANMTDLSDKTTVSSLI